MRMYWRLVWCVVVFAGVGPLTVVRADPKPADRGREALLTRCFSTPFVSRDRYETLWKQWGLPARPADFDAQLRDRYGLHDQLVLRQVYSRPNAMVRQDYRIYRVEGVRPSP